MIGTMKGYTAGRTDQDAMRIFQYVLPVQVDISASLYKLLHGYLHGEGVLQHCAAILSGTTCGARCI